MNDIPCYWPAGEIRSVAPHVRIFDTADACPPAESPRLAVFQHQPARVLEIRLQHPPLPRQLLPEELRRRHSPSVLSYERSIERPPAGAALAADSVTSLKLAGIGTSGYGLIGLVKKIGLSLLLQPPAMHQHHHGNPSHATHLILLTGTPSLACSH